jgi:hypothetical protein
MICENCGTEHDGTYGSGRFCSKKCASCFSTKEKRKDINEKVSKSLKGNKNCLGIKQSKEHIQKRLDSLTPEKRKAIGEKVSLTAESKYINLLFEELGTSQKRRRVIEEQNYKCNRCGLDEWMGIPIVLEYEHKDGNTENNSRDNVECLCPNCHSQTPTWRRTKASLEKYGRVGLW